MNAHLKSIKAFIKNFSINDPKAPHFHKDLSNKEYYPIYISFLLFAISYLLQNIIFTFICKNVIFTCLLSGILAITILTSKRNPKWTQVFFTCSFIIICILVGNLLIFNLKCHEYLFLGIYLCIVYYNMIRGDNNCLSNVAFFFMLIYLSIILLGQIEDLTTFFANLTICLLQFYLTHTEKVNKKNLMEKEINDKKMLMHIFDRVLPGVTIIFKKQKIGKMLNFKLSEILKIEFINDKAKEKYWLDNNNMGRIEEFVQGIRIEPLQKDVGNSKENQKNLKDFMEELIMNVNFCFEVSDNHRIGFLKHGDVKVRIFFSKFVWKDEILFFLNLDDENYADQIKTLQENDSKKNDLLASVTHDLRSPLNGILAFISNAKSSKDKEEQSRFLHFAEINGHLLMSLINDILDYSSFIKEKFHLMKESFSINSLITEVIDLMKVQASVKKIKMKLEKPDMDIVFFSDARRIKQILINLIGNSIKFTIQGSVKLRIKQTLIKNILKFSVIDSGVGIKESVLEKLGNRYATFDNENGLNKHGIGLGLNICNNFISLLGPEKKLNIKSKEGKGTKISFLLFVNIDKMNNSEKLDKMPGKSQLNLLKMPSDPQLKSLISNFSPKYQRRISNHTLTLARFTANRSLFQSSSLSKITKSDIQRVLSFSSYHSNSDSDVSIIDEQKSSSNITTKFSNYKNFFPKESDMRILQKPLHKHSTCQFLKENLLNLTEKSEKGKETLRVLIADDNPFNCFVLSSYLKRFPRATVKFDTVSNGLECVSKFQTTNFKGNLYHFHIIFMDCLMPIKNGFEAANEIKELVKTGQFNESVIVGVSGVSGVEEEVKCVGNGMQRLLTKPVAENKIFEVLEAFLCGKKGDYEDLE